MLKWYNEFPSSIDIKRPTAHLTHHRIHKSLPPSQSLGFSDNATTSCAPLSILESYLTLYHKFCSSTKRACKKASFRIPRQNMNKCIKWLRKGGIWGLASAIKDIAKEIRKCSFIASLFLICGQNTDSASRKQSNSWAFLTSHRVATAPDVALWCTCSQPKRRCLNRDSGS